MKTALLILSLGALLVIAVVGSLYGWTSLGDVEMSTNGIIALVLGVVVSAALGGGLMFLVFYSSRHGYDDDVGGDG